MILTALLFAFALVAATTDLTSHKIYNWTTYPGIVVAIIANWLIGGAEGLEESLKGFGACGLIMLICFVLFNVGGGDVKLMAMLGAFLGFQQGIETLLWTFVLGGIAGLVTLIWRVGFVTLVTRTIRHLLLTLRVGNWLPLSEDERKQLQPPLYLAPAVVLAAAIVKFQLA